MTLNEPWVQTEKKHSFQKRIGLYVIPFLFSQWESFVWPEKVLCHDDTNDFWWCWLHFIFPPLYSKLLSLYLTKAHVELWTITSIWYIAIMFTGKANILRPFKNKIRLGTYFDFNQVSYSSTIIFKHDAKRDMTWRFI